jgi:hypothetical protein
MDSKFTKVGLVDMNCGVDGHDGSKLVALCIDQACTNINKFACLDCIFQSHAQHKIIKLKIIQDRINTNIENQASNSDENAVNNRLKETEDKIKNEIEKIKTNILEILNNKLNNFVAEIYDKIMEYDRANRKEIININLLVKKEIQFLSKDELENLTKYLITFYTENLSDSAISSNNSTSLNMEKKKSPIAELEKFDDNFNKYIQGVNKIVCEFLNTKLLVTPSNILFSESLYFEWGDKFYGNYGFLYNLTNGKLTATKIGNDGTITICRAKDKLNLNENYYIEYYIDCKKFGDIEVGFGKDIVGTSCWLRSAFAYGITNVGIYENGKLVKKEIKLQDGDIVGFEIYLKNNKNCKIILNSKLVHEFKIEIDEIYPMCAIRKISNSVTMRDFKTMN